ncbi:MAG: hypothetical protein EOP86_11070 [Verrucomicrobiaceae bacterium]|nr:MAG: hypothetical protein EOP86_11070 [Verrucomicrobiaceae bacterium]
MPASLEQLDPLLLTVAKSRRVHADGIRFQGLRYVDALLAAYVGETVIPRCDPRDAAGVRLFHEGKFLCRVTSPDLADETVSLRDILRAAGHHPQPAANRGDRAEIETRGAAIRNRF